MRVQEKVRVPGASVSVANVNSKPLCSLSSKSVCVLSYPNRRIPVLPGIILVLDFFWNGIIPWSWHLNPANSTHWLTHWLTRLSSRDSRTSKKLRNWMGNNWRGGWECKEGEKIWKENNWTVSVFSKSDTLFLDSNSPFIKTNYENTKYFCKKNLSGCEMWKLKCWSATWQVFMM